MPFRLARILSFGLAAAMAVAPGAAAETLSGALAKAYENNPSINAVRAAQRALDESVAIAKSAYRPNVTGTLSSSITRRGGISSRGDSASVTLNQTLFDGFQRENAVKGAKAGVFAGQEGLKSTEQDTLLAAVQAYVSVVRDIQIVALRERNIAFLDEQLNAAQARFDVGEATRTDVATARSDRAAAVSQLEAARAALRSSEALYVQIVGATPSNLTDPNAPRKLIPGSIESALSTALDRNPLIRRAQFLVEQSAFDVKQLEGAFLPNVTGRLSASRERTGFAGRRNTDSAFEAGVSVSVPLYQGGLASARVRQSKETLSQARIEVDTARAQVRQNVISAFSDYRAALASRDSIALQIQAAQIALDGLIEEQRVGQRTTLDVLIGRQTLVNGQISAAQNEAILVAAGYELVAALGRMTASDLGLHVTRFEPDEHYVAVADKWYGLRTPDQR